MLFCKALSFAGQLGLSTESLVDCPPEQEPGKTLRTKIERVGAKHINSVTSKPHLFQSSEFSNSTDDGETANLNWSLMADKTSHFWTGTLQMGTQKEAMDVIFDTSSDWLAVEGLYCEACTGNVFNPAQSDTGKKVGTENSDRTYNEIIVTGTEWTDQVCINDDHCVNDFEFFLIEKQTYLKEPMDGFLGLGRSEPFVTGELADLGVQRGPSFVRALLNAGLIEKDTFSLYLSREGEGDNQIHFGDPDLTLVKGSNADVKSVVDSDSFGTIQLEDDLFWAAPCQGFGFGKLTNNFRIPDLRTKFIKNNEAYSIFDTGSGYIHIPEALYAPYLKQLYFDAGLPYEGVSKNGRILTACEDKMPDLHFMFDRKWLTVKRDDYQIDVSEEQDGSLCMLLIQQSETPFVVMGLPVYVGYYSVHDDKDGTISFAATKRSSKTNPSWGTVSTRDFGDEEDIANFEKTKQEEIAKQKDESKNSGKQEKSTNDNESTSAAEEESSDGQMWALIITISAFVLLLVMLILLSSGD